LSGFSISL